MVKLIWAVPSAEYMQEFACKGIKLAAAEPMCLGHGSHVCHSKEPAWESQCVTPYQLGEPPVITEAVKWGQELLTRATRLAFARTHQLRQPSFQPSLHPSSKRQCSSEAIINMVLTCKPYWLHILSYIPCLNTTPHHVSMFPPGMEHTCSHWAPTAILHGAIH